MQIIDFIVLIGIICVLLVIGLTGQTTSDSTEDFFLAGRKLKWHQIGFSLFATNFSASAIVGLTGAAYLTGIAIYNYEWVGVLAMVFFALVLVGVVRRSEVYSITEFLDKRFDARVKTIYTVFIILLLVFVDMAASLYAGGLLLSLFLPGIPLSLLIVLVMGLAITYSLVGGLNAISRTDQIQSVIIIIGALLISYFTYQRIGSWSLFVEGAPDGFLSLIRPLDDRAVPWAGIFTGITVLGAYFWLVNQNMVQWVLSARGEQDARRGLLLAGALKLIVLFIIILPGVAAIAFMPELSDPDMVYPALMVELLPPGILGLVLAGFLAALMSNTDSTVHAASTILTMDFVKPRYGELDSKQLVWVGRVITLLILCFSAVWAPMIGNFGTLFEYIQGLLSYAVAPFVVVYLAGVFWEGATSSGAVSALVTGFIGAILLGAVQYLEIVSFHYLYVPLPLSVLCLFVLIFVSRRSAETDFDKTLIWRKSPGKFQKSEIWIVTALLSAVAVQVFAFW